MDSTPEDVVAIQEAVGDGSTDTANLWVGDNMNQVATAEEGFLGTVSFFNVDNLAFGTDAMQQVAAEAAKVRCMIQGIGDHRSDWVNVGGRVEQARNRRANALRTREREDERRRLRKRLMRQLRRDRERMRQRLPLWAQPWLNKI